MKGKQKELNFIDSLILLFTAGLIIATIFGVADILLSAQEFTLSATLGFVSSVLLELIWLAIGYRSYKETYGGYRTNSLFIMAYAGAWLLADIVDYAFFDFKMNIALAESHALALLTGMLMVIIIIVALIINARYLILSRVPPHKMHLRKWSLHSLFVFIASLFLWVFSSVLMVVTHGEALLENIEAFLSSPIVVLNIFLFMLTGMAFLLTATYFIWGLFARAHPKRNRQ